MRSFAFAIMAALALADDHAEVENKIMDTAFDVTTPAEPMDKDGEWEKDTEEKDDVQQKRLDAVQDMIDMWCDNMHDDEDHKHRFLDGHDEKEEASAGADMASDEKEEKHELKDEWLCKEAKRLHKEIQSYHDKDEDGKKDQAKGWVQDFRKAMDELFVESEDGATSVVSYGAAVVAAISSLFF